MAIYTKKGDKGETGLFGTKRRCSKDSQVFRAVGAIDELNSYLGVVISFSNDSETKRILKDIQENLLTIGSILGGSDLKFYISKSKKLEKMIDKWEKDLPKLSNFILLGGSITASQIHFSRSLSRQAEREVVALSILEEVRPQILVYLNRLSDFLFTLARKVNHDAGVSVEIWTAKKVK